MIFDCLHCQNSTFLLFRCAGRILSRPVQPSIEHGDGIVEIEALVAFADVRGQSGAGINVSIAEVIHEEILCIDALGEAARNLKQDRQRSITNGIVCLPEACCARVTWSSSQ